VIYPKNFENKIGFDKIRAMLINACLSNLGKQKVDDINFCASYKHISELINQVNEFKEICLGENNFPVSYFIDVTTYLQKAKIEGTYLETFELFDLKRSLETIKAILLFFKKKEKEEFPYLKRLILDVKVYPFVLDTINSIINKHGKIKDNASPELLMIKNDLQKKQSGLAKKMQNILKQVQREGLVDHDVSISLRSGRTVIPVPSSNKRKIKGLIHDESSSGKTSYIEPAEIVEINNEIKELEYAEKREIIKILIFFTDSIRPYLDDLFKAYEFLGIIDFIRAKALFAIKINAVKPILSQKQDLRWYGAKHPLLFLSYQNEDKRVVPLDIYLGDEKRILLISGPNAGGKSVCLQTVGLLQYMLQCGLLIPVEENSITGLFENIFIDIGDEQSIENDLSTYSSHLINMKFFIRNSDHRTLLLIDEFGTGTEPMLGGAIAEAILGKFNKNRTFGIITTHYTNLKHFASSMDEIENGAMLFDSNKMQPLFQLQIGKPGSSFAFEIARKIGLSEEILKEATEKIGKGHIIFDKHLRDIARDKRYWENKRSRIRKSEKKLDELLDKYSEELSTSEKQRKRIIEKANEEAKEIVAYANKKIENTIRRIKEINAEKEKTKQIRRELEEYKKNLLKKQGEEEKKIAGKIEKLKKREREIRSKRPALKKTEPEKITDPTIKVGDKVKIIK